MRLSRFFLSLKRKSEHYHMLIHVLLGLICAIIVMHAFPDADKTKLIMIGVFGNLVPDLDHFLFLFIYGRKSDYAKIVRGHLRLKQFRSAANFIKNNHKNNTGIYSHNILSLMISIFLAWYLGESRDRAGFYVFFASWSSHYLFDMVEDILFFKKLNPNWFMKFNRVDRKLNR